MHVKHIELSGGRTVAIPFHSRIINPEQIGRRRFAYLAWFLDPYDPYYLDALESKLGGSPDEPVNVFLTDCRDLWKLGAEKNVPVSRVSKLLNDYTELCECMRAASKDSRFSDKPWMFAYSFCDLDGTHVPVGFSDGQSLRMVLEHV